MRAGAALRDISPGGPVQLCGYPESPVSSGVHDPLCIAAYYFESGGEEALYLTADLCFFARPRAKKITEAVSAATGIAEDHILLAATHTHCAPATDCDIYSEVFGPELCPEYMDFVQCRAVDAAREAAESSFPAQLAWGSGCCGAEQGIGGNRHDPQRYAQDPQVAVLAVADGRGAVRGILVSYALHPTVLPVDMPEASADYVAYLRAAVEEAYPGAVFGFMQGCSGNQSSRYFRREQSFREAGRFGRTIGAEALRVLKGLQFAPMDTPLRAERRFFHPSNMRKIPSRTQARGAVRQAREAYEALTAAGARAAERRSAECTMIGARMMELCARDAEKYGREAVLATATPVELHYLILGGLAIAGVSAEVGLAVKEASPFALTMLSTLTGGSSQSYICSDYAYEAAYYEPSESLYGRGTAEELAAVLAKDLRRLYRGVPVRGL